MVRAGLCTVLLRSFIVELCYAILFHFLGLDDAAKTAILLIASERKLLRPLAFRGKSMVTLFSLPWSILRIHAFEMRTFVRMLKDILIFRIMYPEARFAFLEADCEDRLARKKRFASTSAGVSF